MFQWKNASSSNGKVVAKVKTITIDVNVVDVNVVARNKITKNRCSMRENHNRTKVLQIGKRSRN